MKILIVDDEPGHPTDGRDCGASASATGAPGRRTAPRACTRCSVPPRGGDHRLGDAGDQRHELSARIRAAEDIDYTYIMLLTGARRRVPRRARPCKLGADDVLAKPPDDAEIERGLIAAEQITSMHRQMRGAARLIRRPARDRASA